MGIPAALYAAGFGLAISGGTYFLPGITIGFVATIIFAASCWVESRAWTLRERLFPFAGVIFLFGPIAWVTFHPASIKVLFQLRDSNYPRGTKIAGIEWKDDLTDLRVFIRNETADDYSNLDLTIRTDLIIAGIGVHDSACASTEYSEDCFYLPNSLRQADC